MASIDLAVVRKRAYTATWHAAAALISPVLIIALVLAHMKGAIVLNNGLGLLAVFLGVFGTASFIAFIIYLALAFMAQRSVLWIVWILLAIVFPLIGGAIALFVLWFGVGRLESRQPLPFSGSSP